MTTNNKKIINSDSILPFSILCDYLRKFLSAISARTISLSLIYADLKRRFTQIFNLQLTADNDNKQQENHKFRVHSSTSILHSPFPHSPFSATICESSFLRYLREQFLSRRFTQIFNLQLTADDDNKQQENHKFRLHSPIPHSLRLSAKVPFCDICENNFSLADLRRFKTQIYTDFQPTTYSRR